MLSPRLAAPLAAVLALASGAAHAQQPRVLVFSKTAGFRHDSIPAGIAAIQALGDQNCFTVEASENAPDFNPANLARFRVIVFLCTTGDILDAPQQQAFEGWFAAGHAWVGIHSAADTEYAWPFYGDLLGGILWAAQTQPCACYPNCDQSTAPPALNVADFTCFLQKFAAADPWANCDNSTQPPTLNVADFTCFLQKFAAGCP